MKPEVCSYPELGPQHKLLPELQFLTGKSRMHDLTGMWHCTGLNRSPRSKCTVHWNHTLSISFSDCTKNLLIIQHQILSKIHWEFTFFLFELCRNYLQAKKSYCLPERQNQKTSQHFYTAHRTATFMNQWALVKAAAFSFSTKHDELSINCSHVSPRGIWIRSIYGIFSKWMQGENTTCFFKRLNYQVSVSWIPQSFLPSKF